MAHHAIRVSYNAGRGKPFHVECAAEGTGGDFSDFQSAWNYANLHLERRKDSVEGASIENQVPANDETPAVTEEVSDGNISDPAN